MSQNSRSASTRAIRNGRRLKSPQKWNLIAPFLTAFWECILNRHDISRFKSSPELSKQWNHYKQLFFQVAYLLKEENGEVRRWIQPLGIVQRYKANNETIKRGDIILFYCLPEAQSNILLFENDIKISPLIMAPLRLHVVTIFPPRRNSVSYNNYRAMSARQ